MECFYCAETQSNLFLHIVILRRKMSLRHIKHISPTCRQTTPAKEAGDTRKIDANYANASQLGLVRVETKLQRFLEHIVILVRNATGEAGFCRERVAVDGRKT